MIHNLEKNKSIWIDPEMVEILNEGHENSHYNSILNVQKPRLSILSRDMENFKKVQIEPLEMKI